MAAQAGKQIVLNLFMPSQQNITLSNCVQVQLQVKTTMVAISLYCIGYTQSWVKKTCPNLNLVFVVKEERQTEETVVVADAIVG